MILRDKLEPNEDVSECQRTEEECNFLRHGFQKRHGEAYQVTPCQPYRQAACFKARHIPSGWSQHQCAIDMAQCGMRHYRVGQHPDEYEFVQGCQVTD